MADQEQLVTVPATFLDDVRTLVGNYEALGGKVDSLGTTFSATAQRVTDAQDTITKAVEALLARTGPILGLDVSDLVGEIQHANATAAAEVQKVNALVDETNSFGVQLGDYSKKVTDQAASAEPAPPGVGAGTAPPDLTQLIGQTVQIEGADGNHTVTGVTPDGTILMQAPPVEAQDPTPESQGDAAPPPTKPSKAAAADPAQAGAGSADGGDAAAAPQAVEGDQKGA